MNTTAHLHTPRVVFLDADSGITSQNPIHTSDRFLPHPHAMFRSDKPCYKKVLSHKDVTTYFAAKYPEVNKQWLFNQFVPQAWVRAVPQAHAWYLHSLILSGYIAMMLELTQDWLLSGKDTSVYLTNSYIQEFTHHTSLDKSLSLHQRAELLERYRLAHQAIFGQFTSLRVHLRHNLRRLSDPFQDLKHSNLHQVRVNDLFTHNETAFLSPDQTDLSHLFAKYGI